jgi:hypothetical protein
MITHPFSKKAIVGIARHTCLYMCSLIAALFLITSSHAQNITQSCNAFSKPFDACFEQAGRLLVQGKLVEAQSIYQSAANNLMELPPHLQAATELNLARIDRWQMRFAEAKKRYSNFLLLNPSNTESMIGLSLIAMEEKKFNDSHFYLLQAEKLGDSSQELVLAKQWLNLAWKYQLTMGVQSIRTSSGDNQLPIFTLEYALNQAISARVGIRAIDTNLGNANSLSDFSGKERVLELGAIYKLDNQNSINAQFDKVRNAKGDHSLKLTYDIKKPVFEASTFYQNALQNGLHNQELRSDIAVAINRHWSFKSALNIVRESIQYSHQHVQLGLRYNVNNNTYLQTMARQAITSYQQSPSIHHDAIEIEAGTKPNKFNTLRLSLLADKLANKRQVNAAWIFEGQPHIELRHEWIQDTEANITTQQNNTIAALKFSATPMLDFKLSLSHQSLSKTTSALGLLVYRWQ